ncbi:MAG: PIG-L family deacetylase [Clostridia bacterium]|nr:PIG-L family deacetylase [Clostridia bacterium]
MEIRRTIPFARHLGPVSTAMARLAAILVVLALFAPPVHAIASLASPSRLLVIAPHPDDETLGAGGLIYSASQQGARVKVVFMTMGDGYPAAAGRLFGTAHPSPDDFLALGRHRRNEAVAALATLGVDEENLVFLGYPDGGLADIIENWRWLPSEPYTSKCTGRGSNPYPSTFTLNAEYCASRIVSDLAMILADYMPDLVVIPHPNDAHADHQATYAFAMLAMEQLDYVERTGAKAVSYIVHSGPGWPQLWGYQPGLPLDPPPGRDLPRTVWIRTELTEDAEAAKLRALKEYKSQLVMMPSFLRSFIRTNELFAPTPMLDVACCQDGAQTYDEEYAAEVGPTLQHSRLLRPSGEIISVLADRTDEGVTVTATLAWRPSSSITYRLRMTPSASSGEPGSTIDLLTYGVVSAGGWSRPWEVVFLVPQHDLDRLGAKALFEVATLRHSVVVDRSGWILLRLRSSAAPCMPTPPATRRSCASSSHCLSADG